MRPEAGGESRKWDSFCVLLQGWNRDEDAMGGVS